LVNLQGDAEDWELAAYTPGYRLIERKRLTLAAGPGWNGIALDASAWSDGLIYLKLTASGFGGNSVKTTKVYVLR
jgi:hypothetical protein